MHPSNLFSASSSRSLCVLDTSVTSDSLWPHGLCSTRLLCPWDSPGKSTGVGCHVLLQEIFPTQGSNPVSHIAGRFFTTWAAYRKLRHHSFKEHCLPTALSITSLHINPKAWKREIRCDTSFSFHQVPLIYSFKMLPSHVLPIRLLATGKRLISGLNTYTGPITGCLHPPLHLGTPAGSVQPSLAMDELYKLVYWVVLLKLLSWSSQTSWLQTTVIWNKIQLSSSVSISAAFSLADHFPFLSCRGTGCHFLSRLSDLLLCFSLSNLLQRTPSSLSLSHAPARNLTCSFLSSTYRWLTFPPQGLFPELPASIPVNYSTARLHGKAAPAPYTQSVDNTSPTPANLP